MRAALAYLRVVGWTMVVLAMGYAFAKIQGGFSGWYLFAVVAVLFVYEWMAVWTSTRGWEVAVAADKESLWAGEELVVELRWRRWRWASWLTWARVKVGAAEWATVLPPGDWAGRRQVPMGPLARGEYRLAPAEVEISDFFGLYHVRMKVGNGPTVVVYPQPLEDRAGLQILRAPAHKGFREERPGMTARPYRPGDRLNWIHWRATAARGLLQSREAEAGDPGRWVVCLDLRRQAYAGDPEAFEQAVRAATAVVLERDRSGEGGFWTTDGWWVRGPRGKGPLWPAVRRALAAARWGEPAGEKGGALVDRVIREVGLRVGEEAIVITGKAGAEEWEEVIRRWRGRGGEAVLYVARGTEGREPISDRPAGFRGERKGAPG
ncbi:DUF58 domain-containing protein [Kyrpidia spormannii]|uniref:Uncharacterized protein n=1 Tax=Kyrpidia spormannii TaxID=2055160 RepID=A0ACA8Z508_9BACL|nr:DUF58 domain-containing protein [Kyrpidia spormannii]CAB3389460.1 conserved protein of unknown function [Kyrpidia spormannii]